MSCIGFLTPRQRAALRASSRDGQPLSRFASPPASEGKVARLRELAASAVPGIRASAALSPHAPPDLLSALAEDTSVDVLCCVARNERTPASVLTNLAGARSARVRSWVAANKATPATLRLVLADDPDETVRAVAAWADRW